MSVHQAIADLVRTMHAIPETERAATDSVIEAITVGAVDHVPGTDHAGVLLVDPKARAYETIAPTDEIMVHLDRLQQETGQGPCVEAAFEHHMVRVDDIATDPRWPALSARTLAETPARSSLSFQLFTHQAALGALNLFSDKPNAFDEESVEVGLVYATHASLALYRARQQGDFRSALASRDLIGQAKGMLMERFSIDAVAAFELLRRLSQDTNTPLVDVARQVTETKPA
ncbi:ANTAR domain-containing protein [Gordonia sp. HNM0687]|uniref:ANTAR domain-containing protein n=1 Tax=Gordonia mangrovi TaxID=2665643 RepID=A0A6L7GR43_9ACTN|nr:GAF and ANTAR domain-containing protein [Gordonia mangrovi]MXP21651.1 ANTAR domain-containing protein [Gordonia mangrovi]UVF80387.1 GAF and ANTAR domain-containing protein [Gordonia mangrovi]